MTKRGLFRAAAIIAVITMVARVIGFGRWLVYSHSVSSLCVGNAYSVANQIPNVLYEIVAGGALTGAVVPLLAGPLSRALDGDRGGADEANQISSALLCWTVLVLTPLALVLTLSAGPIAGLLVNDNCPGGADLAATFIRMFAPQVVLYGVGVILSGLLTAHHRFIGPALGPLLSSITVIAAYLSFSAIVGPGAQVRNDAAHLPTTATAMLGWGTTAGVAVMTLSLLVPAWRAGSVFRPTLRFPDGVAKRTVKLASAGMAALIAQQLTVVVVLALQRNASASTLNVFQYSQAVYLLPYAVLVVPLATAAFPRLSRHAARAETAEFAAIAARTTRAVLTVSLLGMAALIAVSTPVTAFFSVLDRGDVSTMAATIVAMAPGLIGFGLIAHVGRALYALEANRTVATATVVGWLTVAVAMVGLGLALPEHAVSVGLGAATSIGMTVAGVALLLGLRQAATDASTARVGHTLLVTGVVCIIAGCAGDVVGSFMTARWSGLVGALVAGLVAAVVAVLVAVAGLLAFSRDDLTAVLRRGTAGA